MRLAPSALALLLVGLAACAPRLDPTATGPDAQPSALSLSAVADSLAAAPTDRIGVARRALIRAGTTPLADFGRTAVPSPRFERPLARGVAAFVPGRYPLARPDLVVLAAPIDGPGAAVVLEVARVLVERSRWTTTPERSVEVALFDGPAGTLGSPLWERANVRAVVVVGGEAPQIDGSSAEGEVTVEEIAAEGGDLAVARRVLDRVLALSMRPPPAPADMPTPADSLAR